MKRSSLIMPEKVFFMVMTSSMMSQGGLEVALYIHVWEALWAGCKGNISSIKALKQPAITASILRVSSLNKNRYVGNSYRYITTATKIRFQFQFSRLIAWRCICHIGWLWNWKSKFGYRIIRSIAKVVKYNDFCDDDGIDNVTLRLLKNSQISAPDTLLASRVMISCITF